MAQPAFYLHAAAGVFRQENAPGFSKCSVFIDVKASTASLYAITKSAVVVFETDRAVLAPLEGAMIDTTTFGSTSQKCALLRFQRDSQSLSLNFLD